MAAGTGRSTDFSAADSALGYLYQVRLALLSSLQRLAEDQSFALHLETLDDVVFETTGSEVDLLQMKHHRDRAANLTDASPDLWKSLRVWMEGRSNGDIPSDARLFLITTSDVGPGSAASRLMTDERDEGEALKRLEQTAMTSNNDANKEAYSLFRALQVSEKKELLGTVIVAPRFTEYCRCGRQEFAQRRGWPCAANISTDLLLDSKGGWFRRALQLLADKASPPIFSFELENEWHDLQEQFKHDALPVDQDILKQEVDADAYDNAVFVHQARLAGIGTDRILTAIRDYYRAFTQRSCWMREELLLVDELEDYEQLLREEWKLQFDRLADEVGEAAAEDAMRLSCPEDLRLG